MAQVVRPLFPKNPRKSAGRVLSINHPPQSDGVSTVQHTACAVANGTTNHLSLLHSGPVPSCGTEPPPQSGRAAEQFCSPARILPTPIVSVLPARSRADKVCHCHGQVLVGNPAGGRISGARGQTSPDTIL